MAFSGRTILSIATAAIASASLLAVRTPAPAQNRPAADDTVVAHTEPSKRATLTFPTPGIIKAVSVIEGQEVKKGDVLMMQDDEMDLLELQRLKNAAESTARLDYAKKDAEYKKVVLTRKKGMGTAATASEVEEAALDLDRSEAQIKITDEDNAESGIKRDQQAVKIKKMTLHSEFDGVVQAIKNHEGELTSMDPDKPAILLVQNDPCYVVIPMLTTGQVSRLSLNETLEVQYVGESGWLKAKIIFIDPVANTLSDTQVVKLELPNPTKLRTGLPVRVKLPPNLLQRSEVGAAAAN